MPIAAGTLALYELQNNFLDSSGNGYTAIENGTVPFVTVPAPSIGTYSAGPFNAVDFLTLPAGFDAVFDGLSTWTISGRVYLNTLLFDATPFSVFFDIDNFIALQIITNGAIRIASDSGGSLLFSDSAPGIVSTSGWYYVAMTFDGTDLKGYVFALPGSSASPAVTLTTPSTIPIGANSSIGKFIYPAVDRPVDGYMNDVRFSNVARTSFPTTDPAAGGSALLDVRRRR